MVRGTVLPSPDSVFPRVVNQNVLTVPPDKQILFAWSVKPKNLPWFPLILRHGSSTSFFIPRLNPYHPNIFLSLIMKLDLPLLSVFLGVFFLQVFGSTMSGIKYRKGLLYSDFEVREELPQEGGSMGRNTEE